MGDGETKEEVTMNGMILQQKERPYLSLRLDLAPALVSKAVTALSPLQFQKQLRLQEVRRLMLGEDLDREIKNIETH